MSTTTIEPLDLTERIFILSKTYQVILQYFAHWQDSSIGPADMDGRLREYLGRAMESESRRDFALLMAEFLAPLNNGHSRYEDTPLFRSSGTLGFRLDCVAGQWLARESFVDEISPGDEILAVEGRSLDSWYDETRRYVSAVDELNRRILSQDWLGLRLGMPTIRVAWRDRSNSRFEADLVRPTLPEGHFSRGSAEGRWLRRGEVAYLSVSSFNRPDIEETALELVDEYGRAEALIVDVRGNTGGSTPVRLIRKLMDRPFRWSQYSSPLHIGLLSYRAETDQEDNDFHDAQVLWRPRGEQPDPNAFKGRVVILMDRFTGSAAEDFVIPFKDNGRALLVGERTWGSTGQPYIHDFGNGIRLLISTKRDSLPDGTPFEGRGLSPDVEVARRRTTPRTRSISSCLSPDVEVARQREDYYGDTDQVLERALQALEHEAQ